MEGEEGECYLGLLHHWSLEYSVLCCPLKPFHCESLTISSRYFFLSRLRHLFGDILERNLGSRAWFSDFYPTWTRQVSKRSQWAGKTKVSPISNINVGGNLEDNACCIFHWRIALIIDLSYEKGIEISARSHVHFLQKAIVCDLSDYLKGLPDGGAQLPGDNIGRSIFPSTANAGEDLFRLLAHRVETKHEVASLRGLCRRAQSR